MSDNKLLAENTIRRFMKLANVESMTDNFVNEKYGAMHKKDDKEEVEEAMYSDDDEINEEEAPEEESEVPMPEIEPDEDEDMEMDMDLGEPEAAEEPGAADMSLSEEEAQLLVSLGERLASAMGGAGEEDVAPEMDAPADEPEMDEPADEPEMEEPEDEPAKAYMESISANEQQELVNEVLRRVTRRLVAARRK